MKKSEEEEIERALELLQDSFILPDDIESVYGTLRKKGKWTAIYRAVSKWFGRKQELVDEES